MRKLILLAPLFLLLLSFHLRQITITGFIKDANGQPLQASVTEKGTQNSVIAQPDGSYRISVNEKAALVFSMVGYESKEIEIKAQKVVNVVLQPATQALNEVVVIGYGAQKKVAVTGSVSSVQAIQGSVPGVALNAPQRRSKQEGFNTEEYDPISENGFKKVSDDPLSTFSIDVDAASYSNVRRFLNHAELPPAGAVRLEEMINYFRYRFPEPKDKTPFSVHTEMAACPWNNQNKLLLIGLQAKKISAENLPPSNLVFLIDVSGSMMAANKLPLVKASLKLLVDQLREQDKVALVVYAGQAGLVLPATSGDNKMKIKDAIDQLSAGGSTAGGAGIQLAYKVAKENLVKGNNRIILCTDGDFNVGVSSTDELEKLVEQERKSGIYLTVLGFGMGNYKDSKMQTLADKGNGNHAYIDGLSEAKKVLVHEFGGTLFTVAKDVKLQVEFNPEKVKGYRLIGYENRLLQKEDFNDDTKDAGELGSGHTVTALYEIVPAGVESPFLKSVDGLKYQKNQSVKTKLKYSDEAANIKMRYKLPESEVSQLMVYPVKETPATLEQASENLRFAAAVAEFGMLLRQSDFRQNSSYPNILQLAKSALGTDEEGYRKEFVHLVQTAEKLQAKEGETVKGN